MSGINSVVDFLRFFGSFRSRSFLPPEEFESLVSEFSRLSLSHPEAKFERMQILFKKLQDDFKEDISRDPPEEFSRKVGHQFQDYIDLANIRSGMKTKVLSDQLLLKKEECTAAYKSFIREVPPFRVASEIKADLPHLIEDCWSYSLRDERLPCLFYREDGYTIGHRDGERNIEKLAETRIKNKFSRHESTLDKEFAKAEWKQKWRALQKAVLEGWQRARPLLKDPKTLTWLTGTSTASLVPMMRMQIPEIGGPALIPTGELIKRGIVPLTGELLNIGDFGVNKEGLSGCIFPDVCGAKRYADCMKTYGKFMVMQEVEEVERYVKGVTIWEIQGLSTAGYLSLERVKISVMRLLFEKAQGSEEAVRALNRVKDLLIKLRNEAVKMPVSAQAKKFSALVGKEIQKPGIVCEKHQIGTIVSVRKSNGTTTYGVVSKIYGKKCGVIVDASGTSEYVKQKELQRYTDEDLAVACGGEKANAIYVYIEKLILGLDALIASIKGSNTYPKMSEEETQLVRNPSGLLFGSFTLSRGRDLHPVRSDIPGEFAVKGPQKLGKDIQVVFTEERDISRVSAYVRKFLPESQIQVVSMKALNYLTAAYTS
jgi:hypothetical protein